MSPVASEQFVVSAGPQLRRPAANARALIASRIDAFHKLPESIAVAIRPRSLSTKEVSNRPEDLDLSVLDPKESDAAPQNEEALVADAEKPHPDERQPDAVHIPFAVPGQPRNLHDDEAVAVNRSKELGPPLPFAASGEFDSDSSDFVDEPEVSKASYPTVTASTVRAVESSAAIDKTGHDAPTRADADRSPIERRGASVELPVPRSSDRTMSYRTMDVLNTEPSNAGTSAPTKVVTQWTVEMPEASIEAPGTQSSLVLKSNAGAMPVEVEKRARIEVMGMTSVVASNVRRPSDESIQSPTPDTTSDIVERLASIRTADATREAVHIGSVDVVVRVSAPRPQHVAPAAPVSAAIQKAEPSRTRIRNPWLTRRRYE
jgi:hypothetical protein